MPIARAVEPAAIRFAEYLAPKDVMRLLGIRCQETLRAYERRGVLHPRRVSRKVLRYDPGEVRRLLEGGSVLDGMELLS